MAEQADAPARGASRGRIGTREAARRLGVKPETVYAYVSRGLLGSRRVPGGRGSTFDPKEVEVLLRRGRRGRLPEEPAAAGHGSAPAASPQPTDHSPFAIHTGITLIEANRCSYRGVDVAALAHRHDYEAVADWLWTGTLRPGIRFTAPEETATAARLAAEALPGDTGLTDRLRVAVAAAATADPLRFDLEPATVTATARSLIATLVAALPELGRPGRPGAPLARRLWSRLTPAPATAGALRCLDAALVLLADHDLAASTLAARVAASARAHPYAVVSAGLGAVDGPLHGAASGAAHRMLTEVQQRGSAGPVVSELLRAGRRVPGLGHRVYPGADPRAELLLKLLEDLPAAAGPLAAAREVAAVTTRHTPLHANIDLALAVLTVGTGMPAEAGEAVFSVARTAGWIAHALEEYRERPVRLRPSGIYTGPRPPRPVP